MQQQAKKPLMYLGIPTIGQHSFYFSQNLQGTILPSNFSMFTSYIPFMEVGRARNLICHQAIAAGAKYIIFRDEDVIAPANLITSLLFHMSRHPDWTVCAGLYATKHNPPEPLVYTEWTQGPDYDWQVGDLKKIKFTGMGCAMIRVSDIANLETLEYEEHDPFTGKALMVKEFFRTEETIGRYGAGIAKNGNTEDAFFFELLELAGLNSYIDTSLLCGHYDLSNNRFYFVPTEGNPKLVKEQKKVVNLGAGGEYSPYELQVDLHDGPNIDVHADIRKLPDDWENTFDLAKAHHILEHIDFGETLAVLTEWVRILKPGGVLQVLVPDMEAFAERIIGGADGKSGYVDLPILGGLYGDQGHPYWMQDNYGSEINGKFYATGNDHNHHKTGFTSRSLGGYMKAAGLDVFHLERKQDQIIAEGRKPLGEQENGITTEETPGRDNQSLEGPEQPNDQTQPPPETDKGGDSQKRRKSTKARR